MSRPRCRPPRPRPPRGPFHARRCGMCPLPGSCWPPAGANHHPSRCTHRYRRNTQAPPPLLPPGAPLQLAAQKSQPACVWHKMDVGEVNHESILVGNADKARREAHMSCTALRARARVCDAPVAVLAHLPDVCFIQHRRHLAPDLVAARRISHVSNEVAACVCWRGRVEQAVICQPVPLSVADSVTPPPTHTGAGLTCFDPQQLVEPVGHAHKHPLRVVVLHLLEQGRAVVNT